MGLAKAASDLLTGALELLIQKSPVSGSNPGYAIVEQLRAIQPVLEAT